MTSFKVDSQNTLNSTSFNQIKPEPQVVESDSSTLCSTSPSASGQLFTFIKANLSTLKLSHAQGESIIATIELANFPYKDRLLERLSALLPKSNKEFSLSEYAAKLEALEQLTQSVAEIKELEPNKLSYCVLIMSICENPRLNKCVHTIIKDIVISFATDFLRSHRLFHLNESQLLKYCQKEFLIDDVPNSAINTSIEQSIKELLEEFKQQLETLLLPSALVCHCTKSMLKKMEKLDSSENKTEDIKTLEEGLSELTGQSITLSDKSCSTPEQKSKTYKEWHTKIASKFNRLTLGDDVIEVETVLVPSSEQLHFSITCQGPFSLFLKQNGKVGCPSLEAQHLFSNPDLIDLPTPYAFTILLGFAHQIHDIKSLTLCAGKLAKSGLQASASDIYDDVLHLPLQAAFDELWALPSEQEQIKSIMTESKSSQQRKLCGFVYIPFLMAKLLENETTQKLKNKVQKDVAILGYLSPEKIKTLTPLLDRKALLNQAISRFKDISLNTFKILAEFDIDLFNTMNDLIVGKRHGLILQTSLMYNLISRCPTEVIKLFLKDKSTLERSTSPRSDLVTYKAPVLCMLVAYAPQLAIELIQKHSLNTNMKGAFGSPLTFYAAYNKTSEALEFLLKNSTTDLLATCDNGKTILHHVASSGSVKLTQYLVKHHDGLVLLKDGSGNTPAKLISEEIVECDTLNSKQKLQECLDILLAEERRMTSASPSKRTKSDDIPMKNVTPEKQNDDENKWVIL